MYEIPGSEKGGANSSFKPAGGVKDKHSDTVGLGAGEKFATGSIDGKGTDRGFHPERDPMGDFNPQNTHEVVCDEYTRDVAVGGQVSFPDEP